MTNFVMSIRLSLVYIANECGGIHLQHLFPSTLRGLRLDNQIPNPVSTPSDGHHMLQLSEFMFKGDLCYKTSAS